MSSSAVDNPVAVEVGHLVGAEPDGVTGVVPETRFAQQRVVANAVVDPAPEIGAANAGFQLARDVGDDCGRAPGSGDGREASRTRGDVGDRERVAGPGGVCVDSPRVDALPIDLSVSAYYNAIRPTFGANWQLSTQLTFVF